MKGLLSVEEALAQVLDGAGPPLSTEEVDLDEGLGRVLASPVNAAIDLPPWDNSSMDGYAIRAADVTAASEAAPARLAVIGEAAAGAVPTSAVGPGQAVRIATGAPLPPGADAVVAVESTTPLDQSGVPGPRGRDAVGPLPSAILVHEAVADATNVRRRGGDLRAGTAVLAPGTLLGPAQVALAAAAGHARIAVRRRPAVAVITTGDELRSAGQDPGPAGIFDANGPLLVAAARVAGATAVHLGIGPDVLEPMIELLRRGVEQADVVIVSGGVSVGPYDVVKRAFEAVGSIDLWRVAVQPGKPFAFGIARRPGRDRPVLLFGLPGNPVSSFVTFELFVRPTLRHLAGRRDGDLGREVDRGVLETAVSKAPGRRAFLRVTAVRDGRGIVSRDATGRARVAPAGMQDSHVLSVLAASEALAIVPESADSLPAGAEVELWWLDRP